MNEYKVKLIERTIIDDLKKPILLARERAEMLKDYKEATGKTYIQMEKDLGLSAGCINQYVQLLDTDYKTVNEMRRKCNMGKFNLYEWINQGFLYTTKIKDVPLTVEHKRKVSIIIERLQILKNGGI